MQPISQQDAGAIASLRLENELLTYERDHLRARLATDDQRLIEQNKRLREKITTLRERNKLMRERLDRLRTAREDVVWLVTRLQGNAVLRRVLGRSEGYRRLVKKYGGS